MSDTRRIKFHMAIGINGILRLYKHRKMNGLFNDDNGNPVSGKEVRKILESYLKKGWKVLPMCKPDECPEFDYFGGGCPGHKVTIVTEDSNDKED